MEFMQVINRRQSIRHFSPTPIAPQTARLLLETINRAPSAGNLQAYELYMVGHAELRQALARAAGGQPALETAPLILVFCTHAARATETYGLRGAELYCVQDAAIACTYAMLAATDLGLASVWIGSFDEEEVGRIVKAPDGVRPVSMLPIGYGAEAPHPTSRRALNELIHGVSP